MPRLIDLTRDDQILEAYRLEVARCHRALYEALVLDGRPAVVALARLALADAQRALTRAEAEAKCAEGAA